MTAVLPVRSPGAAQLLPPAEDTRSAGNRSAGPARTLGLLAPWLVRGVVGLAVAVFLLLAVGPHALGYRTMTMLTGSMAPMIEPGDVTSSPRSPSRTSPRAWSSPTTSRSVTARS